MQDFYHKGRWRVLALLMLGTLPACLDASMVNVILPTITVEFQADINTAQWVPGLHRLVITALLLIYGKIGDKYGHIRLYLVGMGAWVFLSTIVGLSQDIYQLILFRAFQGVAQGITIAMPYAIITFTFPPQERGRAMGLYTSSVAIGTSLGPVFGGVVTDLIGWRFLFFFNSAVALGAFLASLRWMPKQKAASSVGFDLPGAASVFMLIFSIILWVSQGRAWGWTSPASLSLLGFVLLTGLALVWIEGRATHPLLKLNLFANRTLSLGTLGAFFNFTAQYMVMFVMPFYLQFVLGLSPSNLGIIMASIPLVTLVVAPLSGSLSDRIGSKPLMLIGTALCTLALFSMSWLDASSKPLDVALRLAFFGFGAASFNTPNNNAIMSSIKRENLGIASGILNLGRNLGWALGIAVAGTVLYGQTPGEYSLQQAVYLLGFVKVAYVVATFLSATAVVAILLAPVKAERRQAAKL